MWELVKNKNLDRNIKSDKSYLYLFLIVNLIVLITKFSIKTTILTGLSSIIFLILIFLSENKKR